MRAPYGVHTWTNSQVEGCKRGARHRILGRNAYFYKQNPVLLVVTSCPYRQSDCCRSLPVGAGYFGCHHLIQEEECLSLLEHGHTGAPWTYLLIQFRCRPTALRPRTCLAAKHESCAAVCLAKVMNQWLQTARRCAIVLSAPRYAWESDGIASRPFSDLSCRPKRRKRRADEANGLPFGVS